MVRVISIVAQNPLATSARAVGDPAIDAVVAKLMPSVRSTGTTSRPAGLPRAASLQQLARILETTPLESGDIVQIIGHGSPGMLSLGRYWTGQYNENKTVYVLDSNPYMYGILDRKVSRDAKVLLLGCSVGEGRHENHPGDGPTLLFDLARLWSCDVSAPVGTIGPADFDDEGRFIAGDPNRLVTATPSGVSGPYAPTPRTGTGAPIRLEFKSILQMPILGPVETPEAFQAAAPELEILKALPFGAVAVGPVLALPEIIFELDDGRAELLSNGSLIRLVRPGRDDEYLAPSAPDTQQEFAQAIKRVVHDALM